MPSLFVRLDPMLDLRRGGGADPEPAVAASLAELAGADGVSLTCSRDGRGSERDLRLLRELVRGVLNVGLAPADDLVKLALALRPEMVTFLPEPTPGGLEAARGLDVEDRRGELAPLLEPLRGAGIATAALIDPMPGQVKAAQRAGVGTVLLHTGRLVWAGSAASRAAEYEALMNAAKVGQRLGLTVHAAGGLCYQNVRAVVQIPEIEAVHVGHAVIARALLVGMGEAVRELLRQLDAGRAR
jgi:pyridoxine 5-phosphate synthase